MPPRAWSVDPWFSEAKITSSRIGNRNVNMALDGLRQYSFCSYRTCHAMSARRLIAVSCWSSPGARSPGGLRAVMARRRIAGPRRVGRAIFAHQLEVGVLQRSRGHREAAEL